MMKNALLRDNINLVHTTEMGLIRIRKNLNLDVIDLVEWCQSKIMDSSSSIIRKGKNWYIIFDEGILTVNAYSYTIITAHKKKTLFEEIGRIESE